MERTTSTLSKMIAQLGQKHVDAQATDLPGFAQLHSGSDDTGEFAGNDQAFI